MCQRVNAGDSYIFYLAIYMRWTFNIALEYIGFFVSLYY